MRPGHGPWAFGGRFTGAFRLEFCLIHKHFQPRELLQKRLARLHQASADLVLDGGVPIPKPWTGVFFT